jgi:recombination protein RecR
MSISLPRPIQRLSALLSSLQGIGPRLAQRLVLQLLRGERRRIRDLEEAFHEIREQVGWCPRCGFLTEGENLCSVCADTGREPTVICVVEEPQDVLAIESTEQYRGLYHVLGGAMSPMDGIGPEELRVKELLGRIREGGIAEVIVATNPNQEGDVTALYLKETLAPMGVRVTRLARGVPSGGDLEYSDRSTLGNALEGRTDL